MTPEAWAFFSAISAGTIGIFQQIIAARKEVRQVKMDVGVASNNADAAAGHAATAAVAAGEAAELARPISNGFAASVLMSLEELKVSQKNFQEGQRILHLDIRDVAKDLSTHKTDHIRADHQDRKR